MEVSCCSVAVLGQMFTVRLGLMEVSCCSVAVQGQMFTVRSYGS